MARKRKKKTLGFCFIYFMFENINIHIDNLNKSVTIRAEIKTAIKKYPGGRGRERQEQKAMKQQIVAVTTPVLWVALRVQGNLYLQEWERPEVRVIYDHADGVDWHQEGEVLRIISLENCEVSLPPGARVTVERAAGDVHLRGLSGSIQVQKVGGDLSLQELGEVEVLSVQGDCRARRVQRRLSVQEVCGDFRGLELAAEVTAREVHGDFVLMQAGGAVTAEADGDVRLGLAQVRQALRVRASGDLAVYLPSGAAACLEMTAWSRDIRVQLNGQTQRLDEKRQRVVLGAGGPVVWLESRGSLLVSDGRADEGRLREGFQKVDNRWERLEERIAHHVQSSEEATRRAQELAERATRRAQEATRQAEERVRAAMQRLEERMNAAGKSWAEAFDVDFRAADVAPAQPPVSPDTLAVSDNGSATSEEERILILRMLQEKKITVEEAEKLFEALENLAGA